MKFIHTADLHLGVSPDAGGAYGAGRKREIWNSVERLINVCNEEEVDALFIAGDIFHRQPLLRELKELNYLFSTLEHTHVFFIAGNHDYIRLDSYYRSFQWENNVHPLLGEHLDVVTLKELNLSVYGFSYYAREIPEPKYNDAKPLKKSKYEILLAHGGDEKHIPFSKEKLEGLGYDYIALGHIHKAQTLVKNRICYSGSLEPTDKNDYGMHGYILGEIKEGSAKTSFVPFASRSYKVMEVEVNERMTGTALKQMLSQRIQEEGVENLYKVILTGFRDPDIAYDILALDPYGNVLEVLDETHPAYDFEKLEKQNGDNLIGRYIRSFAGCISELEHGQEEQESGYVELESGHAELESGHVELESGDMARDKSCIEYMALFEGVRALLETRL